MVSRMSVIMILAVPASGAGRVRIVHTLVSMDADSVEQAIGAATIVAGQHMPSDEWTPLLVLSGESVVLWQSGQSDDEQRGTVQ